MATITTGKAKESLRFLGAISGMSVALAKRTMSRLVINALLLALTGCAVSGPNASIEAGAGPHEVIPAEDGKADNYISSNAREFELSGIAHAALPEDYADLSEDEQNAALDRAVQGRLNTVSRAIRAHVTSVVGESNGGETGDDVSWFTYFQKNAAETEGTEVVGTEARFTFRIGLVGSHYLMSQLAPGTASRRTFSVTVQDWSEPTGETVEVEIAGSESRDAFPKYDELFADGIYDIGIHFGGDYNEGRFDLETAKWLVEYLLNERGFENQAVTDFESLAIDSPPFTKTIFVESREVEVRVYVYHSDMVTADEESKLSDAIRESFRARDVVIYSGHAGPGAGFILDYQPRHEIPASEFATLEMRDSYQIFVLDGCQTYRSYVDDLMANPNKTFDNVDIVTTVNTTPFSVGYQTLHEFVTWLTITDDAGRHYPISWLSMLRGLNTEAFRSVHYGVHGIDGDPQLNPHASEGIACQPCTTDADCGAGGNLCLGIGGEGRCGVGCTTDAACGEGARCARLTDIEDQFYIPKQCVPRDNFCG